MPRKVDITGKKFGYLTAMESTVLRKHGGSVVWLCYCDCGGSRFSSTVHLRTDRMHSCGKCKLAKVKPNDITGMRFGMLVAIQYDPRAYEVRKGYHKWLCRCDCGVLKRIRNDNLTCKESKSCGCQIPVKSRITMLAQPRKNGRLVKKEEHATQA